MKSKKGITLLVLVITIVVMTILLTVTVITGTDVYDNATMTKFQSEISQIELLVNNYEKRNSGVDFQVIELDISDFTEFQKHQFKEENIVDNVISMYIVDLQKIDAEQVSYGLGKESETDRYIYSSETKKVYYERGLQIGDNIYHRIGE